MNVTGDFHAVVKKLKTDKRVLDPSVPVVRSVPEFRKKALAVLNTVAELEGAIKENSKLYVGNGFLGLGPSPSLEREQFDLQFQKAVKSCNDLVASLKKNAAMAVGHHSTRNATISFLEEKIKQVNRQYNEQRNLLMRRRGELEKLSKFSIAFDPKRIDKPVAVKESFDDNGLRNRKHSELNSNPVPTTRSFVEDVEGSQEDEAVLKQENQQLFNEFTSVLEDVHSIETKVVKIAELQELFADNILVQDAEIHRISDTVVGSTENVKEGNEQIRKAMQNNAGSRIIILFALIVLALSVLFLDWYND